MKQTVYSSDPTLLGAYVAVWTQVELDYSIMASTLSCLGPFMSPFTTSLHEKQTPSATAATRHEKSDAYGLDSLVSMSHQQDSSTQVAKPSTAHVTPVDERRLRPDKFSYRTTISTGETGNRPSTDSMQMIIRKNIEWSVAIA